MSITSHERPGVYSTYDMTSILQSGSSGKAVGIAALCAAGEGGAVVTIHKSSEADAAFSDGIMRRMIRLALANGAYRVYAYGVESGNAYPAALELLLGCDNIGVVAIDSDQTAVRQALRDAVSAASADRRECVGICGACGTVAELAEKAAEINHERIALIGGSTGDGAELAAAAAGVVGATADPSVPLGGAVLSGTLADCGVFSDNEIDTLVRGGVTAVECRQGVFEIVRGVTTRTKTGGVEDSTWRELSTILIVDDVIPTIRSSLKGRFHRAKNSEQTRGAIRSQVILELENKKIREIIADFDDVAVTAVEDNPTVCLVEFSFSVTHGLNQIWVSAHITV